VALVVSLLASLLKSTLRSGPPTLTLLFASSPKLYVRRPWAPYVFQPFPSTHDSVAWSAEWPANCALRTLRVLPDQALRRSGTHRGCRLHTFVPRRIPTPTRALVNGFLEILKLLAAAAQKRRHQVLDVLVDQSDEIHRTPPRQATFLISNRPANRIPPSKQKDGCNDDQQEDSQGFQ